MSINAATATLAAMVVIYHVEKAWERWVICLAAVTWEVATGLTENVKSTRKNMCTFRPKNTLTADMDKLSRFRRNMALASVAGYAISLLTPAITEGGGNVPGYFILMWGWMGIKDHIYAWFANPLLAISLVLICVGKLKEVAFYCALVASVLGLQSFFAGQTLAVGAYIWLLSLFAALAASSVIFMTLDQVTTAETSAETSQEIS